ncbi:hypothetical protein GGI04_003938 [Coemansia thaxteri]|nr:hypothetical protein GGI04_003938 [Coemansia thaxteri]KAJ2463930.1 hypothetical protein GGI02_005114 [Coemansia sp. RSA 2322]
MIEARSKIEFEENKAAASEELERLVREAEQAKRALAEEERKLKLMREYCALTTWMSANREALADMGAQIARVSEPYTKFSQSLAETTRAMPISGVYYSDGEALVDDMQKFADAVSSSFPATESNVKDLYGMASRLSRLYKALGQERELLSECDRLKQSLEHAAVLAVSSKLGSLK